MTDLFAIIGAAVVGVLLAELVVFIISWVRDQLKK